MFFHLVPCVFILLIQQFHFWEYNQMGGGAVIQKGICTSMFTLFT